MSRLHTAVLAVALAASIPVAGLAQELRDREANQQDRIGQGVASGSPQAAPRIWKTARPASTPHAAQTPSLMAAT